ncbi:MAG: alkane 1-monooxygenase [Bacteriovoracaceae bacterium]
MYLFAFTISGFLLLSLYSSGIYTYSLLFYAFVLLPILEYILSTSNETPKENTAFNDLMVYLQLPLLAFSSYLFLERAPHVDIFERVGMIISMGIGIGVIGINVGHELGHRSSKWEQLLSHLLLLQSHYLHFLIEHNRGHHRYVATPEDPASAPKGMSVYFFIPRSIFMGIRSAWRLEKKRLRTKNKSLWSPSNLMLVYIFYQLVFVLFIIYFFGLQAYIFYFLAAVLGIFLLEIINYIEHYGLLRQKLSNGRYEKVRPCHSWNSDHLVGRSILFELTRHSDHHENPNRKYPTLRSMNDAPQLPFGYPTMVLVTLIPWLWFRLMNHRIPKKL